MRQANGFTFCFNSTLVRFKQAIIVNSVEEKEIVSILHWFDSNRLKMLQDNFAILTFQFHTGSIQTFNESFKAYSRARSFNSTLVRFKRGIREVKKEGDLMFQFHTGSIQTLSGSQIFGGATHRFNSTLVRFKLSIELCESCASMFVSIPHWFDSNTAHLQNIVSVA